MTIFKNKSKEKYKKKVSTSKTIRVSEGLAIKLDELQEVCSLELDKEISLNTVLLGIITDFVNDIEVLASEDEDKALAKVLSILNVSQ